MLLAASPMDSRSGIQSRPVEVNTAYVLTKALSGPDLTVPADYLKSQDPLS